MNKIRKRLKIVGVLILSIVCANFYYESSYAASIGWSLVHTNGPSSEWVTSRTYGFDAKQKTISINCKEIQNKAIAHAKMVNLINGDLYEGSTLKTSKAVKGRNYIMVVSFESYGNGYSRPSGTIKY